VVCATSIFEGVFQMSKNVLVVAVAATVLSVSAFAAPDDKNKVVEIKTCPIQGEDASSAAGGSSKVTINKVSYKVNFCCAGCKPTFDKLSQADKEKKLAKYIKKADTPKKKA